MKLIGRFVPKIDTLYCDDLRFNGSSDRLHIRKVSCMKISMRTVHHSVWTYGLGLSTEQMSKTR